MIPPGKTARYISVVHGATRKPATGHRTVSNASAQRPGLDQPPDEDSRPSGRTRTAQRAGNTWASPPRSRNDGRPPAVRVGSCGIMPQDLAGRPANRQLVRGRGRTGQPLPGRFAGPPSTIFSMVDWNAFAREAPRIAELFARRHKATGNLCFLATLRSDGSPRISPMEPRIFEGRLVLVGMPNTTKFRDLARDPRCVPRPATVRSAPR